MKKPNWKAQKEGKEMWLLFLHAIGLTNLSDEQVTRYISLRQSPESINHAKVRLLSSSMTILMTVQTICLVFVALTSLQTSKTLDGVTQRPIVLSTETDAALVPQKVLFIGKLNGAAKNPVVFVRPLSGKETWYVQSITQVNRNANTFRAEVNIGDETTEPGTLFIVAVLELADPKKAQQLQPGMQVEELPFQPESQITVVRK